MITAWVKDSLSDTLFGKTRRLILALLYTRPDEQFYLRRIARETGAGLGPVQRELKQLTNAGMVTRQYMDKHVYYQANQKCPIYHELKSIVVKTAGLTDILRFALEPIADRIEATFIYGSFASGNQNLRSDVDLIILGSISFAEISAALATAQEKLQRELNFTVFSTEEFKRRLKIKDHFIKSLMENPRIFIISNDDELTRLVK
jgi:predicted nucleotidyltransferase